MKISGKCNIKDLTPNIATYKLPCPQNIAVKKLITAIIVNKITYILNLTILCFHARYIIHKAIGIPNNK